MTHLDAQTDEHLAFDCALVGLHTPATSHDGRKVGRPRRTRVIPPPTLLSVRHEQVLALRGQGLTLKVIAIELGLSESTVSTLLTTAQRSLNLARWEVGGPGQQISPLHRSARLAAVSLELSHAEAAVLHLLAEGRSNLEIAAIRGRAVRTVANQVASVFRKLRVGSRVELFALLRRLPSSGNGTSTPHSLVEDQASAA